ncbi:MAG: hypothetical protein H8E36_00900 [Rhodospirillaceae bacterium]|nr:hypothetical protein [Rhodospirillaceae bacterium]
MVVVFGVSGVAFQAVTVQTALSFFSIPLRLYLAGHFSQLKKKTVPTGTAFNFIGRVWN